MSPPEPFGDRDDRGGPGGRPTGNPRERAHMLFDIRRYDDAADVLREALLVDPDDWRLHCELARCLLNTQDYDGGLAATERAITLSPHNEWPWRLRALLLARLQRPAEAVDASSRAIALAPTLADTHVVHSQTLRLNRRIEDARLAAGHAIRLAPQDPATHEAYGRVLLELRDNQGAEYAFRQAIALDPTNPVTFNNLGLALQRQRRDKEATELFARAAALDPTEQLYRRNVGLSADRLTKISVPFGFAIFALYLFNWRIALVVGALLFGSVAVWQRVRVSRGMITGPDGQPLSPGVVEAMREYRRERRRRPEMYALALLFGGFIAMIAGSSLDEDTPNGSGPGGLLALLGVVAIIAGVAGLFWLRRRNLSRARGRPKPERR